MPEEIGVGETLSIPDSVMEIESEAFQDVSAKKIVIPASVEAIGEDAFSDCQNLRFIVNRSGVSIEAPDGVRVIEE